MEDLMLSPTDAPSRDSGSVTRADLADAVVRRVGLSRVESAEHVDAVLMEIIDVLHGSICQWRCLEEKTQYLGVAAVLDGDMPELRIHERKTLEGQMDFGKRHAVAQSAR